MKVGFVGLGFVGSTLLTHLLKAGHEVTVFNRSPGKSRSLSELGARSVPRMADTCQGEAVITILADDGALTDIALAKDGRRAYVQGRSQSR